MSMLHPLATQATQAMYRTRQRLRAVSPRSRLSNRRYLRSLPPQSIPLPPAQLLLDVAGTVDARWFIESGRLAFESMQQALSTQGFDITRRTCVLDFGCGCGRVLRHWPVGAGITLHGTDYNPALIRWCEANVPVAIAQTNSIEPPLNYPDRAFDFIYALSVFTHLPEQMQTSWLDELARVLQPGGLLLITIHGTAYLPQLDPAEQQRFHTGHLVVRNETLPGANHCSAFHPDAYITTHFGSRLRILSHTRQTALGNPVQDIILFQKPPA